MTVIKNGYRHCFTALVTSLFAAAGLAALWGGCSLFFRTPCSIMALVVAVDVAVLMRLSGIPKGKCRYAAILLGTAGSILAGMFTVAAIQTGLPFGVPPHEAIWRITPKFAAFWWQWHLKASDVLFLALSLPAAFWMASLGTPARADPSLASRNRA